MITSHDIKEKGNETLLRTINGSTGIPRLVRFFGPQQTALLEKPHYWNTDLIVKVQFGTFEFSKSTFLPIFSIYYAILRVQS